MSRIKPFSEIKTENVYGQNGHPMLKRPELHPEQLPSNAMQNIDGHPIMGHLFYYLQQIQTRFQNNTPPVNLFPHTTALSGDYHIVIKCLKKVLRNGNRVAAK